jgi:hypothetical protein
MHLTTGSAEENPVSPASGTRVLPAHSILAAPGFGPLRFRDGGFRACIAPTALSYASSCGGFLGMDLAH